MGNKPAVMEIVRSAIAFARANVPRVAGVLALVMLLNIAGAMAASPFARATTLLATLLAGVMANAALLRLAFADEFPADPEFRIGPQGFQFGGQELRLLGAILLLVLFGLIALLFMILLAALFTVGLIFSHGHANLTPEAASHSPDVQMMLSVLILLFAAAAVWVWIRVFTYPAATIAQKRVQVFSTWRLTAGAWWRIFAAVVLLSLPALASDLLLMLAPSPSAIVGVLAVASAAIHAFLEVPLLCGLSAAVYRRLHAPMPLPFVGQPQAQPGLAGPWG